MNREFALQALKNLKMFVGLCLNLLSVTVAANIFSSRCAWNLQQTFGGRGRGNSSNYGRCRLCRGMSWRASVYCEFWSNDYALYYRIKQWPLKNYARRWFREPSTNTFGLVHIIHTCTLTHSYTSILSHLLNPITHSVYNTRLHTFNRHTSTMWRNKYARHAAPVPMKSIRTRDRSHSHLRTHHDQNLRPPGRPSQSTRLRSSGLVRPKARWLMQEHV